MASTNLRGPPTHVRSFGIPLDVEGNEEPPRETSGAAAVRRILGKISFSNLRLRPSFGNNGGQNPPSTPSTERAPIPTMMQSSGETYMTPLPKLSMIVLSIVSASLAFKFGRLPIISDYAWRISICQCVDAFFAFHG
jgi:hypothetical protein